MKALLLSTLLVCLLLSATQPALAYDERPADGSAPPAGIPPVIERNPASGRLERTVSAALAALPCTGGKYEGHPALALECLHNLALRGK